MLVDVVENPTDHERDDLRAVELVDRVRRDPLAVAHDRDPVREGEDLLEPVRDVEHRHASVAQATHDLEEALDLGLGERGRRLVHHDRLGGGGQRLSDHHQLAFGRPEPLHRDGRIDVDAEVTEVLDGKAIGLLAVPADA